MELRRRLTTSREKVGEDGDDGGAKRRSSACTAALQVRLGGGDVLEQLQLRFSEEGEGATAAPSPCSDGDAAVWFDGAVLVFSGETFGGSRMGFWLGAWWSRGGSGGTREREPRVLP
jgi:hypothetical protein